MVNAPRGRHVLEAEAAVELVRREAHARRAADLHRLRAFGAAGLQHLAHRDAERKLVDTGPGAVAGHRVQLGAARFGGADAGPPRAAVHHDVRHGDEGLDVVDHGRLAQVAGFDREGRADAGRAALAFERFEQRRFLAADVGPGAQVDRDVKVRPAQRRQPRPEQPGRAALRQPRLQLVEAARGTRPAGK